MPLVTARNEVEAQLGAPISGQEYAWIYDTTEERITVWYGGGKSSEAVWIIEDTSWAKIDPNTGVMTIYSGPGGHYEWIEDPDFEVFTNPQTPQNALVPLSRKEVYSIYRGLKDIGRYFPLCSNFIKGTLEKLTELNPNNSPISTDIVKIFRAVQNQVTGGFFISDQGSSTVRGSIKEGNAKILYLSSPFIYVSRTIHEGFHISGSNGWLYDRAVAQAISQVDPTYIKEYEAIDPTRKDSTTLYSYVIDKALFKHCPDSLFQR